MLLLSLFLELLLLLLLILPKMLLLWLLLYVLLLLLICYWMHELIFLNDLFLNLVLYPYSLFVASIFHPSCSFLSLARDAESALLSSSAEQMHNSGKAMLRRPAEEEAMLAFANALYGKKKYEVCKSAKNTLFYTKIILCVFEEFHVESRRHRFRRRRRISYPRRGRHEEGEVPLGCGAGEEERQKR